MGPCFSQEGRQHHERLVDYDDEYFIEAENRNTVKNESKRWWRRKQSSEANNSDPRRDIGVSEQSPRSLPEDYWNISEREQSLITSDAFEDISFLFPSSSEVSGPVLFDDGRISNWGIKHKGRALRLRLAKHRILQMAASGQYKPNTTSPNTPITLDSNFFTEEDTESLAGGSTQELPTSFPTEAPESSSHATPEEKNVDDTSESSGLVWKEITMEGNVTAVAMNLTNNKSCSLQSGHLLLAMGDESGNIRVARILDETSSHVGDKDGENSSQGSSIDLGSDAIQFSIEGRVRSLDFGGSDHLVVGGDGCYAWVLSVVIEEKCRRPKEIVVIHKLERIDRIYSVRFSPDRKFLAVGGFDGQVAIVPMKIVWNQELEEDEGGGDDDSLAHMMQDSVIVLDRPGLIYCLDWSPAGNYLAVAGSDKVCGIYDASTFDLVHDIASRSTAIQALRWSHDGKYFAIGDREVAIIDGTPPFETHCELSHTPENSVMAQFRYRITSLCWSPSDSYLAIGGSDGLCLVVETMGWGLVYEHRRTESINALVWGQQVSASNGDIRRYLVMSDNDSTVTIVKAGVEPQNLEVLEDHSSVASSSYFSQSTLSTDWVLREDEFQDLDDVPQEMPRGLQSQANITTVAFSNAGKSSKISSYMAYAAADCSLTIMRTRDWKVVFQVEFAKPIRSLVFSNSNTYLALGGDEGVLNVLSVRSRTMILNSILSSPIQSIGFSKRDERLGVGLEDGILALLDPDSDWEPIGEIDQNESSVSCQDWTSRAIACGRLDGSVTLFDTEKLFVNFFIPMAEFNSNRPVRSVAFGESGSFLSIAGDNGVVSILSAKGDWALCNQLNLGYRILSTTWSPAGRYVAFAGTGKLFHVCDTITWATVKEVNNIMPSLFSNTNETMSISCIDWSPDSKWVAIGGRGIHVLNTLDWTLVGPSIE